MLSTRIGIIDVEIRLRGRDILGMRHCPTRLLIESTHDTEEAVMLPQKMSPDLGSDFGCCLK